MIGVRSTRQGKRPAAPRKRLLRLESLEPRIALSGDGFAAWPDGLLFAGKTPRAATSSPAAAVSLGSTADAFVEAGSYAKANFGKLAYLAVRQDSNPSYNCQSYLKFDLSSVTGSISSAMLTLTPVARGANYAAMTFRVRLLTDSADGWIEGAGGMNGAKSGPLTWNNRPGGAGNSVTISGLAMRNGTVAIDVTSLIQQNLNGNRIASFQIDVLSARGPQSYVYFASREASSGGPSLQVNVVQPNVAPGVAVAAAANLASPSGTTANLSVLGADDAGEANLSYTWSVTASPGGAPAPRFSVNGTNAAKATQVTFAAAGTYTLTARISDGGGLYTTSSIGVTVNQALASVVLTPGSASLSLGASQQFTAVADDQFGNPLTTQPVLSWTATTGTITTHGLFTAPNTAGNVTVAASSSGISNTATVNVGSAFLNLQDAALAGLTQTLFTRDKAVNRADMVQILQSVVQDDGVVDAAEMHDLKTILANSATLKIPGYVQVLAGDVVNGNPANAHYQGQMLGNLAVGSGTLKMTELVNKWFYGTDHPDSGGYTYRVVSGALFGSSGTPLYTDMHQGYLGDCYYIAALGAIAKTSPAAISNMIVDNGDSTWTVRFYVGGTADYVTVDNMLPTSGNSLIYAGMGSYYASSSSVLWMPLVEKAYAQWNETGKEGRDGSNTYAAIEGGWMADVDAQVLGRNAATYGMYTSTDKQALINALKGNQAVTTGTVSNPGNGLVGGHAYAVIGYDASTQKFTLYNPWGTNQPGALSWSQLQTSCGVFVVA
jgi:hypothetical protein